MYLGDSNNKKLNEMFEIYVLLDLSNSIWYDRLVGGTLSILERIIKSYSADVYRASALVPITI